MTWDGPTAQWWQGEVRDDAAYVRDVDPLLDELLGTIGEEPILDLGCGDGRLLARHGALGVDASIDLARKAGRHGEVVVADVCRLPFSDASWHGAYAVLVLEHLAQAVPFFDEAARVVVPGGVLALVINHPIFTAPGSGPFVDPTDGEVLWRWGKYLDEGASREPAGFGWVDFHHRSLGELLTTAARAGWHLERMIERSLSSEGDPLLEAQEQVPRLVGMRWSR